MCDPISLALGAVAGTTLYQTNQARKSAKEAAAAEAEAAQRANAQLADTNRRRREQQSLLAKGAPTTATPDFSLGDSALTPGQSPLSPGASTTSRSTVGRAASSLLSRGAPAGPSFTYGGGGGGRAGDYRMQQL